MSGLQNRLNESCRRCVLAPGTQLAPGAERGVLGYIDPRSGALFGHCSSCGFSSSFASLGRFYGFERSPLCAGTGDDPKGHAGD